MNILFILLFFIPFTFANDSTFINFKFKNIVNTLIIISSCFIILTIYYIIYKFSKKKTKISPIL